jgi:RNA polymerase-associated protein
MTQIYQNHNTLYHDPLDIKSHVSRMLIAYKNIQVELIPVYQDIPQALLELNAYGSTPTWIDREVVVYDARTLYEYLEERYPAPSLLPAVPSMRAQTRMLCYRIEKDWITRVKQLGLREKGETRPIENNIAESLAGIAHTFEKYPYLMSEHITLADCMMAALLWRLPSLGIVLPKAALPLVKYAQRLFQQPFFQESLTPQERALNAQPLRSEHEG